MRIRPFLPLITLLGLLACSREPIRRYSAPKEAAPAMEIPAPPLAGLVLRWALPKGWTAESGSGMRFATLRPPTAGAEVSVIMLPGAAGGELANVNRWRGQIGLEPIDEAGLERARIPVKSPAGPVSVFDFTAGPARMIAAQLIDQKGSTWFLKLTGDGPAVASAKTDFHRLLESLRLDSAH